MCQTRIAQLDLQVIGFTDYRGELHAAVFSESCDEVWFNAVANEEGDMSFFEAEAYHVPQWCEDNGFTLYRGAAELEVVMDKAEG
jgi:hypothetical protein